VATDLDCEPQQEARDDIEYSLFDTLEDIIFDCFRLMMGDTKAAERDLNTAYGRCYYREFFTVLGFPDLAKASDDKPSLAIYEFMVTMDKTSSNKYGNLKNLYDQAYKACFDRAAKSCG
jgi:hypothetical protein